MAPILSRSGASGKAGAVQGYGSVAVFTTRLGLNDIILLE